jgi:CDP-6-deoxy-D-xylo-4-hexulose-3-dehydrase
MNLPITLVKDTIDQTDIAQLISWLNENPRLTKGTKTIEFEQQWSNWLGCKYSVFVNSGSSANLAIFYGLILSGRLKNKKIVFPCVSWVTTVAPAIQLGLEPILCETDSNNLGIDPNHLEKICQEQNPAAVMIVHALAFPNDMKRINEICNNYLLLKWPIMSAIECNNKHFCLIAFIGSSPCLHCMVVNYENDYYNETCTESFTKSLNSFT